MLSLRLFRLLYLSSFLYSQSIGIFQVFHVKPGSLHRTSVVYRPPTQPNMSFQRRWKCIFHWRGRAWLTVWDRVKIPRYTNRLMHRKRVTCELHDCYFCLMTIKHAISRTVEVTHSDGQLWEDIEWTIELLYNSVKTGSQLVWRPVWRKVVVEKAST